MSDCPHCQTIAVLRPDDVELIVTALRAYSSDDNAAPHEDITALIERLDGLDGSR